jgi:hypothetical protein
MGDEVGLDVIEPDPLVLAGRADEAAVVARVADLDQAVDGEGTGDDLRALGGERVLRNYALYHDRYRRTATGWKFAERVYEVRHLDSTPLAGSSPVTARAS